MKAIAVIPARYESSRFPGKPLAHIMGKPMVQWVYDGVSSASLIDSVFVATDDDRIRTCVEGFGGLSVMTGECRCGTDRVYETVKKMDCDVVINVQGDEPLIGGSEIDALINTFLDDPAVEMATLITRVRDDMAINDPNVVKVVIDNFGNALYFSRSRIPYDGRCDGETSFYKHVGIYGYRKDFLSRFVHLEESPNERTEKLEQMRALDNGYKIRTIETSFESVGVDVPSDIKLVEKVLVENKL